MLPAIALLGVIVAGGYASRRAVAARHERAVAARHPLGPQGIIVGAEPIDLPRVGAPAVLLLHGGGDTPQTLRYLADHLARHGYAVRAPLLPGHGRSLREFARVTADDWLTAARDEYAALRRAHDWVAIVGLSMGGALAVQLAAERDDLPALGLLAPYLAMPRAIAGVARLAPLWGPLVPYVVSSDRRSIRDAAEAEQSRAYGVFSARALHALWRTVRRASAALPRVKAPTLVVQSRDDNRIPPADAERAFARLGAATKQLVWLDDTGHVLTVDRGRERVFALVTTWLDERREPARALA